MKSQFFASAAIALAFGVTCPALAQENVWRPCKEAVISEVKVQACSRAVSGLRDQRLLLRAFNRRGLAYVDLRRFDQAIQDFDHVIAMDDKIAGYFDNRSNAYRLKGDAARALLDSDSAVRLAPGYAFVYRSRALILGDLGRYTDAIADFSHAIQINSVDAGIFMDRGGMYAKQGNLRAAVKDYTEALAIDPRMTAAFKERGIANLSLGDKESGVTDLKSYLQSAPVNAPDLADIRALIGQ